MQPSIRVDDFTHHLHPLDLTHTPRDTPDSSPIEPKQDPFCYFSYIPSAPSDHWSLETPLASPITYTITPVTPSAAHPCLAARLPFLSTPATPRNMGADKLLQLQTAAAHPQRPRPQPHQDVLELSDDSSTSSRSSSDASSTSSRSKMCSRCQTTFGEFVAYSLNSYYCKRCAKITGFGG